MLVIILLSISLALTFFNLGYFLGANRSKLFK
ncbi:hypothetical protein ATHL_01981 [Anaerolinea thermolimosa]|nr:hypothetical protein ATHL_01981 [Anaerolinea thermolimosa]